MRYHAIFSILFAFHPLTVAAEAFRCIGVNGVMFLDRAEDGMKCELITTANVSRIESTIPDANGGGSAQSGVARGNFARITWDATELVKKRKSRRGTVERKYCEVTGVVRGEQDGPAIITVRRRASTEMIQQKEINIKRDGEASVWRLLLKGECYRISVSVERKHS